MPPPAYDGFLLFSIASFVICGRGAKSAAENPCILRKASLTEPLRFAESFCAVTYGKCIPLVRLFCFRKEKDKERGFYIRRTQTFVSKQNASLTAYNELYRKKNRYLQLVSIVFCVFCYPSTIFTPYFLQLPV